MSVPPRTIRALCGVAAAGLLLTIVARPFAWGVETAAVVGFWAFTLTIVIVPGVLFCLGAGLSGRGDAWMLAGQGTLLGLALHGLAFLLGRSTGWRWLPGALALALAALGVLLWRRRGRRPGGAAPLVAGAAALALLLVTEGGVLLQTLYSAGSVGIPVPLDLLFHAGNAAELRHRWPLEDPRVAGLPLKYHFLSYALAVDASEISATPLADNLLGVAPLFWVGLLALQVANLGRRLFQSAWAGVVGAGILLFHADPGEVMGLGGLGFNSPLAIGIYGSPTTVVGLLMLTGIGLSLADWLEDGRSSALIAFAVFCVAASAAKTTVVPAVVLGLVVAASWSALVRARREARACAVAVIVAMAAALPLSLLQAAGSSSYPQAVTLRPGLVFLTAPFAKATGASLGLAAFPLWLVGYFGLAGAAAVAWLVLRERPLGPMIRWGLGMTLGGLLFALLFDLRGLSQLFVLYNGQLFLAGMGGGGLVAISRPRRGRLLASLVLGIFAVVPVSHVAKGVLRSRRMDGLSSARVVDGVTQDYRRALGWLRRNATRNTVVFADNPSFILSSLGEVRLFYENGYFTARCVLQPGDCWLERVALQERLLRTPSADAVAAARRAIGPGPRLLIVADAVQSQVVGGVVYAELGAVPTRRLSPESNFKLLYAGLSMQVYEAIDSSR